MTRAIVIGSGFGGLAAAIRLAARGCQVTILERRDRPGGRGYVYRQDGFVFDGGPTVITAPWLFDELFALAGRDFRQMVELVPLDPYYRIFFHDGSHFDYAADLDQMVANIRHLSARAGDDEGYRRLLTITERIFQKGFVELADQPFLQLTDMLRIAPDLLRLGSYRTVYGLVSSYIRDDRLRQALSFHPLLVGGNPFTTTSIYALIHHLEREWGVWFAMGGTGAIVDAMTSLFAELGGNLVLGADVERIQTQRGRISAVRTTDGREYPADLVVSNADVEQTYLRLLEPDVVPRWWRARLATLRQAMSLVVIYFGTDRTYRDDPASQLAHHTIILGPRYRGLLDDIFERKILAEDFSLYLHMPTMTDPSLAPPGHEAFYVLSPVPNLRGPVDWDRALEPYVERILAFLEARYLPDLRRHIVTRHVIDPRHFASVLGSTDGSAFAYEPVLTQSAWFRPHNRSEIVPNLYLVGAGTHPGAGVPGVLVSAKIVDDLIAAERRGAAV